MKKVHMYLFQIVGYIMLSYLAYSFLIHGIGALQQNPGFVGLITGIGIPFALASILIVVVGIFDILIAIVLFVYRTKWVFLYAALWPLVPALAGLIVTGYFNWLYLQYTGLAVISYWIFIELGKKDSFFSNIYKR